MQSRIINFFLLTSSLLVTSFSTVLAGFILTFTGHMNFMTMISYVTWMGFWSTVCLALVRILTPVKRPSLHFLWVIRKTLPNSSSIDLVIVSLLKGIGTQPRTTKILSFSYNLTRLMVWSFCNSSNSFRTLCLVFQVMSKFVSSPCSSTMPMTLVYGKFQSFSFSATLIFSTEFLMRN